MKFEWDSDKAAANIARHGVSFDEAKEAFMDLRAVELLDETSQEEERWLLLGRAGARILVVVYTERLDRIRIISARKANRREQKAYLEQNHSD